MVPNLLHEFFVAALAINVVADHGMTDSAQMNANLVVRPVLILHLQQ